MRAVWLKEFGGPEVLVPGDAPDPVPGPGQVLIDVAYANITFVETQFRSGAPSPFKPELPMIPGNGVGGIVTAVGEGVGSGLISRRVVTSTGGSGGYAERAAVDASGLFTVPDGLELDDAVAVLADGRTATMMIRATAPQPGERVLVEAAAGGVGSLLVQLAKSAGATVVGAAGGSRKTGVARDLGADEVVDYMAPSWTDEVDPVDVARAAFELLGQGGRMVSFGLASGEWAAIEAEAAVARGITLVQAKPTPETMREYTESALAEAVGGRLRPLIGQRFPLDRAADAHAAIESRASVGKTLLEVR
ncbi:zinc-binding dehydrogenase [Nonomuraea sp. NPDC049158]|uniref:zinc-binding dehydrogenase n=1 Tax=Nonomuraea sp. NPDC049158 TaxID=3155649 RepID=UPI0033E08F44